MPVPVVSVPVVEVPVEEVPVGAVGAVGAALPEPLPESLPEELPESVLPESVSVVSVEAVEHAPITIRETRHAICFIDVLFPLKSR